MLGYYSLISLTRSRNHEFEFSDKILHLESHNFFLSNQTPRLPRPRLAMLQTFSPGPLPYIDIRHVGAPGGALRGGQTQGDSHGPGACQGDSPNEAILKNVFPVHRPGDLLSILGKC